MSKPDKKIVIYVIGVFDLFHVGHLQLLQRAKSLGTKLVVAVNSDDLVSKYKRKPIINEKDRLKIIKALDLVDNAFLIDTYDNKIHISKNEVDIIVHGDDWPRDSYMRQIGIDDLFLLKNRVELELVPYTEGISTSQIIRTIHESNNL